jgi:hypothetical protein
MLRLGLRLSLRSGREAAVRLVVTMCAVAIGVAVLLSVLAEFHAFQATSNRPSWESTTGNPVAGPTVGATAGTELWNYSESLFEGHFIETLDVAALGSGAPVIPGLTGLPAPGTYDTSPALAALLRSVPADQLGGRFPGTQAGTIGDAGLSGPQALVIVVGYTPTRLAALPNTVEVNQIFSGRQVQGTTNIYRMAFIVAAVALLFPLLILVNTATRLAAARREERYAALRLVGATPRQVGVIASVDATVGAMFGAALGIGAFLVIRLALTHVALSGAQFFPQYVTPTAAGYLAMLVGVPIAAAIGSRITLRRVQISPLGVSRKVTPKPPGIWRVIPLLAGIPVFVYPVVTRPTHPDGTPVAIGLVLIMLGFVLGGSWLTMQAARLLGKVARGASSLLAARRLADNPKGSFRTVAGLVLAVLVGTMIAVLAPAINAVQSPPGDASLTNVLRAPYGNGPQGGGLDPATSAQLIASLQAIHGVTVIPLYVNPAFANFLQSSQPIAPANEAPGSRSQGPSVSPPADTVISCADLQQLTVLGACPAGATAVTADTSDILFTDNPLFVTRALPLVTAASGTTTVNLTGLSVQALLVKATDQASLEQARTLLTNFNASLDQGGPGLKGNGGLSAWQMGDLEPETFGEMAAIRNNDDNNIARVIFAILGLTLLVAGCSLAVTVGGSLVERKRQFTLLRLSGTPVGSLRSVVLMESVLPLIAASVVAAIVGAAITIPVIRALLPELAGTPWPSPLYYLTMGAGMVVAVGVVLATMPLLGRMTQPSNARFE